MLTYETGAYFSKLKDLGITTRDPYPYEEDIIMEGEGETFELHCTYRRDFK